MLPGPGQSGGELAVLDVLADFVNIQGVAGVAQDSLGFIAGFQLCLAVGCEARGRLPGEQPMHHGGLWAGLCIRQRHRKAGRPSTSSVTISSARLWTLVPRTRVRVCRSMHTRMPPCFVETVGSRYLCLAGLATLGFLNVLSLLVELAIKHACGQHLDLCHEAHHPLPGHGFDQRAVLLTAWRHPAGGVLLCDATFGKDCLLQGILQPLEVALSAIGNAVNAHVFKHSCS